MLRIADALIAAKFEGDRVITEKEYVRRKGFWKRHLDKIGVGGSLFAALCCLGFPALVSILSAIGLGFLIDDDILRPLLIVFLMVAVVGLAPRQASSCKPVGTDRRDPERGDDVCVHLRLV